MRVLGIDPGTVRMGFGVVDEAPTPVVQDFGVVTLPGSMALEHRLYQLFTHVSNMISVFQPTVVAVEDGFVGEGARRFIKPAIALGQAQGVVLISAASHGIPVFRYTPAQVKQAITDYGAAPKGQVREAIAATLGLAPPPETDAADALSVCICHLTQARAVKVLGREIAPGSET